MTNLTFAEQVKVILKRKGMTIKALADLIEKETGKKMSRQNLTQKLGRDNFQEQDMRLIASILGCDFTLDIMGSTSVASGAALETKEKTEKHASTHEGLAINVAQKSETEHSRDITVGELVDITNNNSKPISTERINEEPTLDEELDIEELIEQLEPQKEEEKQEKNERGGIFSVFGRFAKRNHKTVDENETVRQNQEAFVGDKTEEDIEFYEDMQESAVAEGIEEPEVEEIGEPEINPYSGREYESNSVRMHPSKIGYVQVYSRRTHTWTDMTEWAFLGYQERQKALLGEDYEEPTYLD